MDGRNFVKSVSVHSMNISLGNSRMIVEGEKSTVDARESFRTVMGKLCGKHVANKISESVSEIKKHEEDAVEDQGMKRFILPGPILSSLNSFKFH